MAEELTAASLEETEVGAQHPWPYLAELFEFLEKKKESYLFKCRLCIKNTTLSALWNSPSNLKKHIEVSSPLHD